MIHTTNAIESLNMPVRKVIKNRGHFPNDKAAPMLIYLACWEQIELSGFIAHEGGVLNFV